MDCGIDCGYSHCMQAISFSDYKQLLHKSLEYIRLLRHKYDVCSFNFYSTYAFCQRFPPSKGSGAPLYNAIDYKRIYLFRTDL